MYGVNPVPCMTYVVNPSKKFEKLLTLIRIENL